MIASNLSATDVGCLVLTNRYLNKLLTPELYTSGSQLCNPTTGQTPLHWAAENNQLKVASLLISRGARRSAKTYLNCETPLHRAVRHGHLELAKCVFEDSLMEIRDIDEMTPVHVAAFRGHNDILQFILSMKPEAISTNSPSNMTPLHYAAEEGHAATVVMLLSRGAKICENTAGHTPLHCALNSVHENVVKIFLENDRTDMMTKMQPMLTYAFCGTKPPPLSLLNLLIDHGADVNTNSQVNGQSPIFYAAGSDNTAILELFLRHGGDVTAKDYFGVTPLHEAAAFQPATVDILIGAGARVNERDDEGQTPLYWAVERGREDVVRTLLEKGADINAVDACGMSPLIRACAQCCVHVNTRMVKLLIENGAAVESKDADGMTALHHASREGHTEIVSLLLKRGARVRDRDRSGDNALDIAEQFSKIQVIDLLRQSMGMVRC